MSEEEREQKLAELEKKAKNRPPDATEEEMLEDEGMQRWENEPRLRGNKGGRGGFSISSNMGGGIGKIIFVSLVVSLAVVYVLVTMINIGEFVTQKDFDNNWQGMSASINDAKTSITQSKAALDVAVANIPKTVDGAVTAGTATYTQQIASLTTQVSSYTGNIQSNSTKIDGLTVQLNTANNNWQSYTVKLNDLINGFNTTNTNVTNLQTKVSELTKSLSDANVLITTLQKQDADKEARIKVLESKLQPAQVAKSVTASIKTISNTLVATSNTSMSGSIRVELKNNTAVAVKDIVLDIAIQTGVISGYGSSELAGAGTIWQGQGIPWNMIDFMNTQWGLNLAASETKVLYLTYTVTGTGFWPQYQTYGVPFQVSVDVL